MTALRHRLYRRLHPRRYRAGQLAEQRHQLLDLDAHLVREDYTQPAALDAVMTPVDGRRAGQAIGRRTPAPAKGTS
ncbi:hypothetical protein [Streptomyces sp. ISL-11]|uniref:hypothetical protein n=1 Tax=Streptomyces sp. ISL-11 TaxID=2819174 RepID=UPI001BE64A80|nr:hypothetical protein [Streptomyces sp. ISL-11]MBT2383002.1 hypothetical protein [Streptomyces sp. ISL-11]